MVSCYAATITEADFVIVTKKKSTNKADNIQGLCSDPDVKVGYITVSPESSTRIIIVRSKSKSIDNLKKGKNVKSKSRIGGVDVN